MGQIVVYNGPTSNNDNNARIQTSQRSTAFDPVDKLRVSTPQSLIDTDFEYGQQASKWEQTALQNNRAGIYYLVNAPLPVTAIAGNQSNIYQVVLTFSSNQTIAAGTPIFIEDAIDPNCNGWGYSLGVSAGTSMTVQYAQPVSTATCWSATSTYVYQGYFYSNQAIALSGTGNITNVATVTPSAINGAGLITIPATAGLYVGVPITITGTAGGSGAITGYTTGTTYYVSSATTPTNTQVTLATTLAGAFAGTNTVGSTSGTLSGLTAQPLLVSVTTAYPHGLSQGSLIYVTGLGTATNPPNGSFIVTSVPTANSFTYYVFTLPSGSAVTYTAGQANIYARQAGWVDTHAYDGSVNFTAGAAVPNATLQRQTRRYFRYQSGKGIQFSTGTILKPQIQQPVLTSSGSTVTVTTKLPHNLTKNTTIIVSGADQSAYNGSFIIASVPNQLSFTYKTLNNAIPTATTATSTNGFIHVSPNVWYGSGNRLGFFDQQNGLFFEYNGQTLNVVYRNSINQIVGTVSVTNGSGLVTGTSTQFTTQLVVGDYIVIRGQSYRVIMITSDTALYISPEYRGTTIANAIVSRTIDTKVPQSQWYDTLDGTNSGSNPSGYNLDLTKVQMFYLDYSWYGAGVARFGLRTTGGAIQYVYAFQNNNIQYSAYMRSGNLPSHYEQNGVLPVTTITSSVATTDTTINVASTANFNPLGGYVKVIPASATGAIEYMSYTGLTSTSLTGVTRAIAGGSTTAQAFTYSATAPVSVEYYTPDTAALMSHWGSSVVMDGGFNNDISAIYNYGMTTSLTSPNSTANVPIMAIRIAPSVDNGTVGLLGVKEIINRLQLQLREIAVVTNTTYLIQLVLNGIPSGAFSGNFVSPVQGGTNTSSISQIAVNTTNTVTISGGESIAAFYSNSAGQTTYDLTSLSAIGNSALGGGTSNSTPTSQSGFYPDGPDILYVVATTLSAGASNTVVARINWQESQA